MIPAFFSSTRMILLECHESLARELGLVLVFVVEVFNALQTRFRPSTYTPLETTLQNANPKNCTMKTSLEVLNIIDPPQEPLSVLWQALSLQEVEFIDG